MTLLLIATRNLHKVGEIRLILDDGFRFLTLADFPLAPEVSEDAGTFAGNAVKKSLALAKWLSTESTELWAASGPAFVLSDDSGLEVDALNGAPGVHSARFAALDGGVAGNSAPAANNAKLLKLLKDVPDSKRTARFRCVLALTPVLKSRREPASPVCYENEFELATELFEGVCEGRIALEAQGAGGFGYDPLFIPDGCQKTFGELSEAIKNQISHRAKALAKLRDRILRRI
ncbi:MAG TPA: non-canonical purine NTP pyrophosphatase [Verrucomicrobiae bacterium]|nr:non-canonical purine NTP pyrophosphatase [Verrucomicrobiae bacterium]